MRFWKGFGGFGGGKTLPKSFQNQDPKKHAIWHRFLLDFSDLFYLRFLENMHFASTGARFFRFLLKSRFCNFHAFLLQKTSQKTYQNNPDTMNKSSLKTGCSATLIF